MNMQTGKCTRNLFVVDTEAPWIRSLLHAMPADVRIHGFRIRNSFSFPGGLRRQLQIVGRSEKISESWDDTWVSVPSWHKAFGLSSWLLTRQIGKAIRRFGRPDEMLFNLPWYAGVAGNYPGASKAYYAYDAYRFYEWDSTKVMALEKRMLDTCAVGFGVAKLLVADLQAVTKTPVYYLPNATSWQPGDEKFEGMEAATKDFASLPKPCVGCVGQINSSAYDWDLMEYLSGFLTDVHFIFIGPRFKEASNMAADRIEAIFARSNVHWLGPRPHAHLPAYLKQCNVLINPLRVNEHNDRRSLLRLYDYLTTDRPIVSTAIAEAFNHLPHIHIAKDKEEFRRLLGEALLLKAASDLERRREYIAANTWHARAVDFWQYFP